MAVGEPVRIMYVDHSPAHGGSLESLSRTIRALDKEKFLPVVVLSHVEERKALFEGIRTEIVPWRPSLSVILPAIRNAIIFSKKHSLVVARALSASCFVLDCFATEIPRFLRLYRIAKRHRARLIHLNNACDDLAAILAAGCLKIHCVSHHRDFTASSPLTRWQACRVDWNIAVSQAVRSHVLEFGVDSARVSVVYDPIDSSEHDPSMDIGYLVREFAKRPDEKFFGIFGRVVDWKGHRYFLEAAAEVFKRFPSSRAFIVGGAEDGPSKYVDELKQLSERLGIASKIIFSGFRRDVAAMMKLMDVVVHASVRPEPFGMVVIEAMSMSRPIIATIGGGPSEIIENGVNGLLVPCCDSEKLAVAICSLLGDAERADRIGARAAIEVRKRFLSLHAARKLESVYSNILEV